MSLHKCWQRNLPSVGRYEWCAERHLSQSQAGITTATKTMKQHGLAGCLAEYDGRAFFETWQWERGWSLKFPEPIWEAWISNVLPNSAPGRPQQVLAAVACRQQQRTLRRGPKKRNHWTHAFHRTLKGALLLASITLQEGTWAVDALQGLEPKLGFTPQARRAESAQMELPLGKGGKGMHNCSNFERFPRPHLQQSYCVPE